METLKTTDTITLTYGNAANGRHFKSWRIYARQGRKLRTVATMESDAMSPEREHELAQLFTAAPDLLEALKMAVLKWEMRRDIGFRRLGLPVPTEEQEPGWVVQARAAIAKAQGR